MRELNKHLAKIIALLEHSDICSHTQIKETAYFSGEQYSFKLRATLPHSFTLQIRIYYKYGHCDYSYQLFLESPVCRWDNSEHFPQLASFPHHYHTVDGQIIESSLKGEPIKDLPTVLAEIEKLLKSKGESSAASRWGEKLRI